ncbi:hypothetical protein MKEN_00522100 [Mycena kentingensis (nom. inval.)]|nr:hypothetical protein MKEN_00522100 [Mycena kentingensis (nom. inval.)]
MVGTSTQPALSWVPDCEAHAHTPQCSNVYTHMVDYFWQQPPNIWPPQALARCICWSAILACEIMDKSKLDDLKDDNAADEHPELRDRVDEIMQERDTEGFEALRRLTRYRLPTFQAYGNAAARYSKTFRSFSSPYIGNQHRVLLSTIDRYIQQAFAEQSQQVLTLSAALVQASCTGKSRATREVANERFSVSFCLREEDDKQLTYPPADTLLRNFLLAPKTKEAARSRLAAFVVATLDKSLAELKKHAPPSPSAWQDHLAAGATTTSRGEGQTALVKGIISRAKALERDRSWLDISTKGAASCKKLLAFLRELGMSSSSSHRAEFIIVLDEAHTLAAHKFGNGIETETESILGSLQRVLRLYTDAKSPIFFLFLSTNSKLEEIVAPLRKLPSLRKDLSYTLFPIITETIGFDLLSHKEMNKAIQARPTLETIVSPDLALSFGRPAWRALYDQAHESESERSRFKDVFQLVVDKMKAPDQRTATALEPGPGLDIVQIAHLAWASQRLLLSMADEPIGRGLSRTLAESYMRVILTIPVDRERVVTTAPSEPLLVEVCAQLQARHGTRDAILLEILFQRHLIAKGERGAAVTIYLHIRAHDKVNRKRYDEIYDKRNNTPNSFVLQPSFIFHRPVRLLDWVRALVVDSVWQLIRKAIPIGGADTDAVTFETAFADAWICTSHFAQAADEEVIKRDNLWNYFFRGVGLQCQPGQEAIDTVCPVLFVKPEAPFSKDDFGALYVQTKNRAYAKKIGVISPSVAKSRYDL